MMKKVFIDTNILLDVLCERSSYLDDAIAIFDMAVDKRVQLIVSDLTIANIKYITRKDFSIDEFCNAIMTFRPILSIVPIGEKVVDEALKLRASDFEDSLQYFSAVQAKADCLVTRNIKDFGFSEMNVLTPHEFLSRFA